MFSKTAKILSKLKHLRKLKETDEQGDLNWDINFNLSSVFGKRQQWEQPELSSVDGITMDYKGLLSMLGRYALSLQSLALIDMR